MGTLIRGSTGRRDFLRVAGGSAVLSHWLSGAVARAQGGGRPKRLLVLMRPNGSVAEDWIRGGQRGPIMEPFAPVWANTVAIKGVNVRPSNGKTGGSHEAGLVTIMTGAKLGATYRTNDDFRSTAESLDQTLAKASAVLGAAPVRSVQLGAHGRQDGGNEIPNVTMSYAGAAMPLYPTLDPADGYKRLFGDVMPGGTTAGGNQDALIRARRRRRSVLDFVKQDLARTRGQFPAGYRDELDQHEGAIREIERSLDIGITPSGGAPAPAGMPAGGCARPALEPGLVVGGDFMSVARVGALHLKILAAAFSCDVTRVATFQWATGASGVSFGPMGSTNHHSTSHRNTRPVLSVIDKWYSERTLPFIQQLIDTPDAGGGRLIDNTLVFYVNEVSEGWNHSFNDYPFLLFGGDGVGLKDRGRIVDVSGQNKTSNDIWTALAPVYGATLGPFGTMSGGTISGLLAV
jgi:hypothetical protein